MSPETANRFQDKDMRRTGDLKRKERIRKIATLFRKVEPPFAQKGSMSRQLELFLAARFWRRSFFHSSSPTSPVGAVSLGTR